MIVINKKYKLKLLLGTISVSPELAKLLDTLIIMSKPLILLKYIKVQNMINNIIKYKSSLCSLINLFLLNKLKNI